MSGRRNSRQSWASWTTGRAVSYAVLPKGAASSAGEYCVPFDPTQQKTEFIQQIQIIAKRATHWLGVAKNRLRESGSRQDV